MREKLKVDIFFFHRTSEYPMEKHHRKCKEAADFRKIFGQPLKIFGFLFHSAQVNFSAQIFKAMHQRLITVSAASQPVSYTHLTLPTTPYV